MYGTVRAIFKPFLRLILNVFCRFPVSGKIVAHNREPQLLFSDWSTFFVVRAGAFCGPCKLNAFVPVRGTWLKFITILRISTTHWKVTSSGAEEVWVETVVEGGRRFMTVWSSKEEVDAARHRQEKRKEAATRETGKVGIVVGNNVE